jgi:hypothetical protein
LARKLRDRRPEPSGGLAPHGRRAHCREARCPRVTKAHQGCVFRTSGLSRACNSLADALPQRGTSARYGVRLRRVLVDAAMPPIIRGLFRARKIWIDDAQGSAARCRRVALRQRRVAALVIVAPPVVHMQANRISRIVRLSPSRRRRQNRRERQNRQSRNAHRSSSVPAPAGSSDRNQTGPFVPGQFTFARWGALRTASAAVM